MQDIRLPLAASLLALVTFAPVTGLAHGPGGGAGGHAGHAAHGTHAPQGAAAPEQKPWGIAGDPRRVTRTIQVTMGDNMRFSPARLQVREGETIRFVVRNNGRLMHEIVLGTREELQAHAKMMAQHPGMEHDEPYMAHVAPGKRGSLVWTFNRAGDFEYACLVAGHFEAGMVGRIQVLPAAAGRGVRDVPAPVAAPAPSSHSTSLSPSSHTPGSKQP